VSELLRPARIGIMVDLYSHLTATMQRDAVAALKGLSVRKVVLGPRSRTKSSNVAARARSSVGQSSGLIRRRDSSTGIQDHPLPQVRRGTGSGSVRARTPLSIGSAVTLAVIGCGQGYGKHWRSARLRHALQWMEGSRGEVASPAILANSNSFRPSAE